MFRPRTLMPSPQDLEQPVQSFQSDTTQSTGHVSSPQRIVSVSAGHDVPPDAELISTGRERVFEPPPQLALHGLQKP
jgi:hypothetical protein